MEQKQFLLLLHKKLKENGLSADFNTTSNIFEQVKEVLSTIVASGQEVKMRDFGTIGSKPRAFKKGLQSADADPIIRYVFFFKASGKLKNLINDQIRAQETKED